MVFLEVLNISQHLPTDFRYGVNFICLICLIITCGDKEIAPAFDVSVNDRDEYPATFWQHLPFELIRQLINN